ncbi:hypothetical protein R1sor_023517 [Riccia sorocarpa]|uniref:Uncharacterized protein n=1 Tax=Riccia sorocarpa TaxID=122646 RepID=A0ABD3GRW5_9MARC
MWLRPSLQFLHLEQVPSPTPIFRALDPEKKPLWRSLHSQTFIELEVPGAVAVARDVFNVPLLRGDMGPSLEDVGRVAMAATGVSRRDSPRFMVRRLFGRK